MKRTCGMLIGAVAATVLGLGGMAKAAPLVISGSPDLTANALTVTYTYLGGNVGEFVVTGTITSPNTWTMAGPGGGTYTTGSYTLDAFVNVNPTDPTMATFDAAQNGKGSLGNSLTVTGNGGALFTSDELTAFGFNTSGSNGSPNWQFEFTGTGPSGALDSIGVSLHGNSGTAYTTGPVGNYSSVPVDFDANFGSMSDRAGADTFVLVPLPSAAWMGLSLPAMALMLRRKRVESSL